mgnify:CR=1
NFQRVFMRPINNQRLLMDSLGRSRVVNKINNFFNIHHKNLIFDLLISYQFTIFINTTFEFGLTWFSTYTVIAYR